MVVTTVGIVQRSDRMVVSDAAIVQRILACESPFERSIRVPEVGRSSAIFRNTNRQPEIELDELSDPTATLEQAVAVNPNDARALVALANHYWLSGSGPEPVSDLASRAISADPANRAAWHLWALAESNPRQRLARWQQVSERFPTDDLARANVADNAASLAGAEHDYDALDLAIATYEQLLTTATHKEQRDALDSALRSLRGWRL